jgi:hypothetical protein
LIDESERIRGEAVRQLPQPYGRAARLARDQALHQALYRDNPEFRALVDGAERIQVAAQQGDAGNATAEGGKLPA